MIQAVNCAPRTVKAFTTLGITVPGEKAAFPLLQIDRDSYIVGAEIQSGINFHMEDGCHCIQIGKWCSLAERITFLVDLNHDYRSVVQGDASFLDSQIPCKSRRKGSILIQNDVWIGHGATILGGITVHNGAVIAAEAVVTKDVPAYAIVGGNPAKVIGYRFSEEQIRSLLDISWWDWSEEKLRRCGGDFALDIDGFIQLHLPEAEESWPKAAAGFGREEGRPVVLFIPDFADPYPLWKKVLREYVSQPREQLELVIYLPAEAVKRGLSMELLRYLEAYEEQEAYITVQDGQEGEDLRGLFASSDYFVTTRSAGTITWTGYVDHYHVKLLYGTDVPVFSGI